MNIIPLEIEHIIIEYVTSSELNQYIYYMLVCRRWYKFLSSLPNYRKTKKLFILAKDSSILRHNVLKIVRKLDVDEGKYIRNLLSTILNIDLINVIFRTKNNSKLLKIFFGTTNYIYCLRIELWISNHVECIRLRYHGEYQFSKIENYIFQRWSNFDKLELREDCLIVKDILNILTINKIIIVSSSH